MAKSVVFFDTEIGVDDKKIHDIGAVRSDKGTLHTASVSDFCAFAADSDFLCGHNVVHHDMKYLAPVVDGRVPKKIIDTLYLSPLLFPKRPYHRLLKDDMVRDYNAALQFVQDYFNMDFKMFIATYFKGERAKEIERNITPEKYNQLFGELSDKQAEIINDADSKYIVVAAGPGSGKTRVLVHKLASLLLLEDVKHEQLLMVTFSRAAATEFKKRLVGLIGNAANFVEIKTFHSYCFDLLGKIGTLEASSNENIINSMIGAKECDNSDFLNANNRKLKIVGKLPSEYEEIPVVKREDGTLKSLDPQYEEYIRAVNETSNVIRSGIVEVIDFIREKIFANKEIRTQEISFTENHRVLALCDLSSDDAVLEIKTFDIFNSYKTENVIRQMYYQKGDKELYAMSIIFDFSYTKKMERRLDNLIFRIYKVEIKNVKEE